MIRDGGPDPAVHAAARALAAGDPLGALKRIALHDAPPALALRGIAMAQLGDFAQARRLLGRAARGFAPHDAVARARCVAAQAEIALACRDLASATVGRALDDAARVLAAHGDQGNALFARLVGIRRLVLLGRVDAAGRALAALAPLRVSPRLVAVAELIRADLAVRLLQPRAARAALTRAQRAAHASSIPSLVAEIEQALRRLDAPAARLIVAGQAERAVALDEVVAVLGAGALVVDACRREVRAGRSMVSLVSRPVLFALALALAGGAPAEVARESLIRQAFEVRRPNPSHRARLRVELGRLRSLLRPLADLIATSGGFALVPRHPGRPSVLLPPGAKDGSAILALLAAGESWSTSALAAALAKSQRSVQRALGDLLDAGKVRAVGAGRAQRWVAPPPGGFATTLLLVPPGPVS